MTSSFTDHIEKFITSLNEDLPEIFYQAFDFSQVNESRNQLMKLNYDKSKVSFLNLDMIADLFQLFAAVHSSIGQNSSREFSVEVPYRLCTNKSVGDALRIFGGYGKVNVIVISILDQSGSEKLFQAISQIENVKKMTQEQLDECLKKNRPEIDQYYFGSADGNGKVTDRNPIGEIVNKMIVSKHL